MLKHVGWDTLQKDEQYQDYKHYLKYYTMQGHILGGFPGVQKPPLKFEVVGLH